MAVRVKAMSHRYGDRAALSGVSFDVRDGELFALLGPNGSGKSTLFRILATLQKPGEGTAEVFGNDVMSAGASVRRHLGVTFQSPAVDRKLTVRENLTHHGHLYGLRGVALARRIEECLDLVGLRDRLRDPVEKLSGGMSRRVEIAKCLLHEPRVLLMDEPSTGLDPTARRALREQIETLRGRRGLTCLLTTHLMEEAESCDRVAILDEGRLVAHDSPRALKQAVGGEVLTLLADRPDELAEDIRRQFSLNVQRFGELLRIEASHGHELAARLGQKYGDRLTSITVGRPTLEDVFAKFTGHRLGREREE